MEQVAEKELNTDQTFDTFVKIEIFRHRLHKILQCDEKLRRFDMLEVLNKDMRKFEKSIPSQFEQRLRAIQYEVQEEIKSLSKYYGFHTREFKEQMLSLLGKIGEADRKKDKNERLKALLHYQKQIASLKIVFMDSREVYTDLERKIDASLEMIKLSEPIKPATDQLAVPDGNPEVSDPDYKVNVSFRFLGVEKDNIASHLLSIDNTDARIRKCEKICQNVRYTNIEKANLCGIAESTYKNNKHKMSTESTKKVLSKY